MADLSTTIAPKSDQLNADDLIVGPRTVTITRVSACPDSAEQPIAVNFDGDGGKPYKPCKSMRRVLVHVWGRDGDSYVGRAMTLYRDPEVQFGGLKVGGIRISHMSHIDRPMVMALTETRAKRKPYTVQPLASAPSTPVNDKLAALARAEAELGTESFRAWFKGLGSEVRKSLQPIMDECKRLCDAADAADAAPGSYEMTPDERAEEEAATAAILTVEKGGDNA